MSDIELRFNDKLVKFPESSTYYDVSKSLGYNNILGIMVNNRIASLADKIAKDAVVTPLDINTDYGNRIYTAGLKMIFEYSVRVVIPNAKVKFSYNLPQGLVAEINYSRDLTIEQLEEVKNCMSSIVKEDIRFEKIILKNSDGYSFYKKMHNKVKSDNIQNITDATIFLYRLKDLINYYYSEMPYSTSAINIFDLVNLGNNLVLLNYPSDHDNGILPEVNNYKGIINAYIKGKRWLYTMNVPYINDINREVCNGNIASFVRSSELNFNLEINDTAKYISTNKNIKYVMISGPSTSGKTTVTKRLSNYFEIYGLDPVVISLDDYFKERVDTPKDKDGNYDFECLEALDLDYLNSDIQKILSGEEITLPKFNFITGKKELTSKKVKLSSNSIVLFEGLHAINDNLLTILPSMNKYKIYVSPYIPLCLDEHNYISHDDLRLIRRLVRDFRTRGYNIEKTIKSNKKVKEGEIKYITPYISKADMIINTSLPYEVGVLKVFAAPLLYSVSCDSAYYSEARRLLSFLKQFFTISSEFVPQDSILREFIGGDSNND